MPQACRWLRGSALSPVKVPRDCILWPVDVTSHAEPSDCGASRSIGKCYPSGEIVAPFARREPVDSSVPSRRFAASSALRPTVPAIDARCFPSHCTEDKRCDLYSEDCPVAALRGDDALAYLLPSTITLERIAAHQAMVGEPCHQPNRVERTPPPGHG